MGLLKTFGEWVMHRSPAIATGAGAAGLLIACYEFAKTAPKANLAVDNATIDKGEDLTRFEEIKVKTRSYAKPIIIALISFLAVIAGAYAGARKRALLEAALSVTTTALTTQTNGIIEKYGPDAVEAVRAIGAGHKIEEVVNKPADIPEKGLLKNKQTIKGMIGTTAEGTQLYWDEWRGVPFETTPTRIISAVAEANKLLRRQDELTMNEFYSLLDVKHFDDEDMNCRMGDKFGWSNRLGPVELEYKMIGNKTVDGREYLIYAFNHQPVERLYS